MEHFALNQQLFNLIYAGSSPTHWQLIVGAVAAKYLLRFFLLFLIYQWVAHPARRDTVYVTIFALGLAVLISYVIGLLWPTARPFVDGIGQNYLPHKPDYSFPSDHATVSATIAFCFLTQKPRWIGVVLLILALIICWGRVYMGLHYPLDILGGIVVALISTLICYGVYCLIKRPAKNQLSI